MSDETRRKRAREAELGDSQQAAMTEADLARMSEGIHGFLNSLIGRAVYIEGVRINYRGTLRRVLKHGDGMPGGLVLEPCQRVSWFTAAEGPRVGYTFTHRNPTLVPYEMIHHIAEEGFLEAPTSGWAPVTPR